MKFNILVIFTLLFISSCSFKNNTGVIIETSPVDSIQMRSLPYISSWSINYSLDSNSEINVAYIDSKRRNIFVVNRLSNVIDSFPFPKQISGEQVILEYQDKKVTIFSLSDNMVIKLNKNESVTHVVANKNLFLHPMFANFELLNNTALFFQIPFNSQETPRDKDGYPDMNILGIYGLQNDTFVLKKSYIKYPRVFQDLKYSESPPVCNRKNENELYYLFDFSDSLSYIDMRTDKLTNYFIEGLPKCKISTFSKDSVGILSNAKHLALKNEIFAKILFDKHSSDFIIIKELGIDEEKSNSIYQNTFKDKPVIVYLVRNFKVIKTFKLTNASSISSIRSYYFKSKLYISSLDYSKIYIYNI